MFQIVRMMLDDSGGVVVRRPLQPLFERLVGRFNQFERN
jgi:hypothetical protein